MEPFLLDESSHIPPPPPPPPPDGNSFAPQLDSVASEVRKEHLQEEEAIEKFFRNGCVDVWIIATNTSVSLTLEQGLTC